MGGYLELNPLGRFLLPLYSGRKVWEGIWNQTHLVVLNFCLERSQAQTVGDLDVLVAMMGYHFIIVINYNIMI